MSSIISLLSRKYMLYAIALIAIVVDQYTKLLVRKNMVAGETIMVHPALRNIFDLTYTTNTGVAFGMFKEIGPVVSVLAILVVAIIIYYNNQLSERDVWLRVALGMQMGGAIGNNLIDRLFLGSVVDFLHIHYWPIFNVADSCITVGVVIIVVLMIREIVQEKLIGQFGSND
jgi:signal peptidase II